MGTLRTANGRTRSAAMQPIGATGLDTMGGFIRDDFMLAMQGAKKIRNLNEMRLNSPIIGAALSAIKYPVRNIDWFYVSDLGEEDPRLELLNEAFNEMAHPWGDHLLEAMTMLDFGFAPCAIQYRREGSKVLWDRFMLLGQETIMKWIWDNNKVVGVRQWPHIYRDEIPIERVVLYRINVERDNPEGRSMLRQSWVPYYYTKELQKIEAIGKERGMAGLPVVTLPPGATTNEDDSGSDASKAAKIVRNIRVDEQAGIVLPSDEWKIELLSTGVNSELAMNTVIQRYEARMLMSMLAQFLMLGFTQTGTQSKATIDRDLFNLLIGSIADIVAEAHNRQAIPRLMQLNGMDHQGLRIEHSPPGDPDLAITAEFIEKALGSGALTWTPEDEAMLRSIARLPERDPEEIAAEQEAARGERDVIAGMMGDEFATRPRSKADRERQKQDREWQRDTLAFLQGQMGRVVDGAKDIER